MPGEISTAPSPTASGRWMPPPTAARAHCQLADTLGDKALKLGVLGGGVVPARQMRHEADAALQLDPRNIRCLKESMGLYEQSPAVVGGSKEQGS